MSVFSKYISLYLPQQLKWGRRFSLRKYSKKEAGPIKGFDNENIHVILGHLKYFDKTEYCPTANTLN